MIDVPSIYNDPIISKKRLGTPIQPFERIKESITVDKHRAILTEIPNKYERVKVTGRGIEWHESKDRELKENTFWVDYNNGVVYFHESVNNITLTFEYLGEGVFLYPDSRVYHTGDKNFPTIKDKISDIDRAILVERHRIDEQILSHPQPSEVVDMRIDYNGKIYRVAKDRIDAEQRKIEEAYVDAKGVKYNSLKERIDSLQLGMEKEFNDVGQEISKIWSEFELIPGKISLEVGRLENDVNEYINLLQSQINLIPGQIEIKVQELTQYIDGEVNATHSLINMLSDELELKVDVNGVISAINLSSEGVRISGKHLWLDGNTRIDNAVIKSAHIDSIDASKIKVDRLDALTTNTGTLNVTDWINILNNNKGIRASYDYGDPYGRSYNARWFVGEYELGYRYQKYLADVHEVTSGNTKGNFLYYAETFYGADMVKLRQYTNKQVITNPNATPLYHLDIQADRIVMGKKWETGIVLDAQNHSIYTEGASMFGERTRILGDKTGLLVGRINAPMEYQTLQFNNDRPGLGDLTLGVDGIGRYVQSTAIRRRTYDLPANVYVSPDGKLGFASSSKKFKVDIQEANSSEIIKKLMELNAKTWINKHEYDECLKSKHDKIKKLKRTYGLVAEDLHELGLYEFVSYDENGEVVGIHEARLVVPLIEWNKRLQKEVENLKQKLDGILKLLNSE